MTSNLNLVFPSGSIIVSLHFVIWNPPVGIETMPPFQTFSLKFLHDVALSKFAKIILLTCQVCHSSVSMLYILLVHPVLEPLYSVTDCHIHIDRVLDIHLMMNGNEYKRQLGRQPKQSNGVPVLCFSLEPFLKRQK